MPDWLFHWTHDRVFLDMLKVFITALGPIGAGVITWFGIRWTGNLTKQTLENTQEATPPELLRLEKWSSILKDSNDYPENIKHELDVNTIQSTYNDVLKRATLENRLNKLGIAKKEVLDMLLMQPILSSQGRFPKNIKWKNSYLPKLPIFVSFLTFSLIILNAIVSILINGFNLGDVIFYAVFPIGFLSPFYYFNYIINEEKSIIFRNAYKALADIFVLDGIELKETHGEKRQRKKFKNRKMLSSDYKFWEYNIKDKHPDWGSWNYGLNIDWNNDPDAHPIEYYI